MMEIIANVFFFMIELINIIFFYIFDEEIFPAVLIFLASIFGIKKVGRELHFRSMMNGMTEKIERIHSRNHLLEELCTKQISALLDETKNTNRFDDIKTSDIRKIESITKQLISKSIGASRPLGTYALFLKYCLSNEYMAPETGRAPWKLAIYNVLIRGLEIIQRQALTTIESPKKPKLEKKSPIIPELREFTSSDGFNSTPDIEIGPTSRDSTDEALYFYAVCLQGNLSFENTGMVEAFFKLIGGNHPFCVLMKSEKILPPTHLELKAKGLNGGNYLYHAINYKKQILVGTEEEYVHILYSNIKNGIQLNLSNQKPDDIISRIIFKGPKTDLNKRAIHRCQRLEDKYIILEFRKHDLQREFKRNRKELETLLLENSGNLTNLKKAKTHLINFFRFKS